MRRLPRLVPVLTSTVVAGALVWHGQASLASALFPDLTGGVWLAHARDLQDGVFYRPMAGPDGYGGTRYFPLFFAVIAAAMRAGLPPLAAGWLAGAISLVVFATGLYRASRAAALTPAMAVVVAAAAVAPYYVQQSLVAVRGDVLAAGLNLWGLALTVRWWRRGATQPAGAIAAAAVFALAVAVKVTSLAMPAGVVAALALSRQPRPAAWLAAAVAAGTAAVVVVTNLLSDGRALELWRAGMLAGAEGSGTIAGMFSGALPGAIGRSGFLVALFAGSVAAVLRLSIRAARGDMAMPDVVADDQPDLGRLMAAVFLAVTASTALTLSSPGTIVLNQLIEWTGVAMLAIGWAAAGARRSGVWLAAILLLAGWAVARDGVRARELGARSAGGADRRARAAVVDTVRTAPGLVLSEAPLYPVMAGRHPYLLDAFSFRVLARERPALLEGFRAQVAARAFSRIVLLEDPDTPAGRGWYTHVHFGWPAMEAILAHYELEEAFGETARVYRPK